MEHAINQDIANNIEKFFFQPFEAYNNIIVASEQTLLPYNLAVNDYAYPTENQYDGTKEIAAKVLNMVFQSLFNSPLLFPRVH